MRKNPERKTRNKSITKLLKLNQRFFRKHNTFSLIFSSGKRYNRVMKRRRDS